MKIKTLLAGVALSALAATAASAAGPTLKFGHVGKPGSLFESTANYFAKCVNDTGKATVEVFGSSQLGKDKELLQKVKLGQVDFALPSSVMSSVDDRFGVFEMPYIIKDREHMRRVWDALGEDVFQKAAGEKGYRIVGLAENGFRHITNNVRPINVPDDLAGHQAAHPQGARGA